MYVKRDYSRSFFNKPQQPRRPWGRFLFLFGLLAGGMMVFISANFDSLQAQALDAMGMGPTPTPLPGDLAMLGSQLMIQGNVNEARDLFERAIAQRPENINYRYEYGRMMIEMSQPAIAREQGDAILALNPDDPRGYALRAMADVWQNNSSAAIPMALAGLDLRNGYESHLYAALSRAYVNTGNYQSGVQAGRDAVTSDPTDANARRAYANALSWMRRNDEAIDQLESAIMLDPNNIGAHMELALQYLAQNRDQEAINIYDRVLAIQPRNARALRRLCGTYRKIGQFERAVGFCEDAVAADPTAGGAWYELGILQYNAYRMDEARHSFAQCVDLDPSNYTCKHRLGLAYYYVGECDLAWETLQDSLVMAQSAQGLGADVSGVVENIQAGLQAILNDCVQVTPEMAESPLVPALDALQSEIAETETDDASADDAMPETNSIDGLFDDGTGLFDAAPEPDDMAEGELPPPTTPEAETNQDRTSRGESE